MKLLLLLLTLAVLWCAPARSSTLEQLRSRGRLACGVVAEAQDWDKEDLHGDLSPLGSEICRAFAIAALGRPDALDVVGFPAEAEALRGLARGQVEVLAGVTPSVSRSLQYGITFGPPIFWDTQTFMVRRALGVTRAAGLAGKTVCFIDGTDDARVLLAAMRAQGVGIVPFPFQEEGEMEAGLVGGHCAAISAAASRLAGMRAQFHALVPDFVLLPDVLAVVPAAVASRGGDTAWTTLVAATVNALVQAETLGISRPDLAAARRSADPVVQRLLGTDFSAGLALGLAHDWSAQVIAQLGNYGDILWRTAGGGSLLALARGLNAVCLRGGAMCAVPLR